jgi:hypothetical protein
MITQSRQNVLDLIRKGAYSSCIITSYSFDFIFFEERLMPALKSTGVKNINLFLDGNYFDEQLENSLGKEFSSQRTYAINTIYDKGIFHPKIILLTGPKQGLLIIGSGNISTSGMSGNDEVWGAFHMNGLDSTNAPIFAQAWNYLHSLFGNCHGFNQDKIHWISQQSPWLNDLSELSISRFTNVKSNLQVLFLKNESENSIYQQLYSVISKEEIQSLTIVSPFFDQSGQTLVNFLEDYNLGSITCLTDSSSGLLPSNMDEVYHQKIRFYQWSGCVANFNHYNRLHAKIYHFTTSTGEEYLLLGSCNATMNALGNLSTDAKNNEVAILLKRKTLAQDFLSELGISTDNAPSIDLHDAPKKQVKTDEIQLTTIHQHKIIHAEIEGVELDLTLNQMIDGVCVVVVRDKFLQETERHQIGPGDHFTIKLSFPEKALQAMLFAQQERISNIRPIHNAILLARSNPDQTQADINNLVDSIMSDGDYSSIESIIQYLEYARKKSMIT